MNEIAHIDVKDMTVEQLGADIRLLTAQAKRTLLDTGIQIGYRLQVARDKVEGSFAEWVERETEFSKSSAYRFIQLYEEYGAAQGSIFGVENLFPTLGKVSISNALRLLAVPEEERESFAREVDAEHISARELDEAIRERDEAIRERDKLSRELDAEREAGEGAAMKVSEAEEAAQRAEEEKARLTAKVRELENRPIEVDVQVDEEAVQRAADAARKEAEKAKAGEIAALKEKLKLAEQQAKAAEEKAGSGKELIETAARSAAKAKEEAAEAKQETEELRKKLTAAQSGAGEAAIYCRSAQESFFAGLDQIRKIHLNAPDIADKLLRGMESIVERLSEDIRETREKWG